jgi:hypothetical protein
MIAVDSSSIPDVRTILGNVGWIVDHLDDHGLEELGDVPVLELAKHISVIQYA